MRYKCPGHGYDSHVRLDGERNVRIATLHLDAHRPERGGSFGVGSSCFLLARKRSFAGADFVGVAWLACWGAGGGPRWEEVVGKHAIQ